MPANVCDRDRCLDIQFIHVRSRHENAMALIMSHGWPGPRSWVERSYHKLIYFNEATRAATSRRGMSRTSSLPRYGRPSLQISALRAHRFSGAVRADEPSLKSGEEVGFRRRGSPHSPNSMLGDKRPRPSGKFSRRTNGETSSHDLDSKI